MGIWLKAKKGGVFVGGATGPPALQAKLYQTGLTGPRTETGLVMRTQELLFTSFLQDGSPPPAASGPW